MMELDELLKGIGTQTVLFQPNPGNTGDALIAAETLHLFERLKVRYQLVNELETPLPAGHVVVYGGGGNLGDAYGTAEAFIRRNHRHAKRLILLPQTIAGHEDLLSELGSNVDIYCREHVTHKHVISHSNANVHLADDIVMGLMPERYQLDSTARLTLETLRLFMLSPHKRFGHLRKTLERGLRAKSPRLLALRTDRESARHGPPPEGNEDVSTFFTFGVHRVETIRTAAYWFLRYINRFEEVETDRLHIAIAAARLGKQVVFRPNSYFKCRAVYEFSMQGRFPNVRFLGASN